MPVCPCARGSRLCPGARASDVLGACCLSVTQTLYSPEAARLHQLQGAMSMDQAVAVCLSTLRGSYGRCKGRCLIWVLTMVCGILPVNFRMMWLLFRCNVVIIPSCYLSFFDSCARVPLDWLCERMFQQGMFDW